MLQSLDTAVGRLSVLLIGGYQRYLSPIKGYSCAHRAWFGGDSCSEFARQTFASEGFQSGLARLRARFRTCHAASRALRADRFARRSSDEDFDLPPGATGASARKGEPTRRAGECLRDQAAECCCWCGADACASTISP